MSAVRHQRRKIGEKEDNKKRNRQVGESNFCINTQVYKHLAPGSGSDKDGTWSFTLRAIRQKWKVSLSVSDRLKYVAFAERGIVKSFQGKFYLDQRIFCEINTHTYIQPTNTIPLCVKRSVNDVNVSVSVSAYTLYRGIF